MILEKLEGLSDRHSLKIQRPWFSADDQREVTLGVLKEYIALGAASTENWKSGAGAPATAGALGDVYRDTTNGVLYIYGNTYNASNAWYPALVDQSLGGWGPGNNDGAVFTTVEGKPVWSDEIVGFAGRLFWWDQEFQGLSVNDVGEGSGGTLSAQFEHRKLWYSVGRGSEVSIDWNNSLLCDINYYASLNWDDRTLRNVTGQPTVNWDQKWLGDGEYYKTIDWADKVIYGRDSEGEPVPRYNWNENQLYHSTGNNSHVVIIDLATQELKSYTGGTAMHFSNSACRFPSGSSLTPRLYNASAVVAQQMANLAGFSSQEMLLVPAQVYSVLITAGTDILLVVTNSSTVNDARINLTTLLGAMPSEGRITIFSPVHLQSLTLTATNFTIVGPSTANLAANGKLVLRRVGQKLYNIS